MSSRRNSNAGDFDDDDDDAGDDIEDVDDSFLNDIASPTKTPFKKPAKFSFFVIKVVLTALPSLGSDMPNEKTQFITLPQSTSSAKSPKNAKFIVTSDKRLLEIQKGKGQYSWFMNNKVSEDGGIFLATPLDPLFHMIERLDHLRAKHAASDGKFVTADQIFTEPSLPSYTVLQRLIKLSDLQMLCDSKEISGETFYRLNDDKLLEWLKRKVDSVCEYLETMPDAIGLIRAQVVGYKITEEDKLTDDQLIHLAIGFLKEYVPANWINALKNAYGLDTAAIEAVYFEDVASRGKKRKAGEFEDDLDDAKTPAKKLKKSVSQAKLDKVDKSGMKSLSSFFRPVAKK